MGPKLNPFEQAMYQRTDEVLHYLWDPIGVAGCPQARDEYYAYLPQVFGMLLEGKGEEEITLYLVRVEDERMGLSTTEATKANAAQVASFLVDWRETLASEHKGNE
ncbi:hypothetical protein [Rubrivivax albus]|uniref:Uncharacterized protein n=1 Tax=Rubrivivax albus TaxID=2499835 RepID=A0A3S2UJX4_9BURK|nr:hypothetical protein [Rubrivivax albus]RVT47002.1 hypothetical protein ENE75_24460 [Rubrivivax albus]